MYTNQLLRFAGSTVVLALTLTLFATPVAAATATYYWDPGVTGGSLGGGGGTWSTSTANWWLSGTSDSLWTDTSGTAAALFGGTAGTYTVNVSGDNTANALIFNTAGYALSGGTVTLAGTSPTITANANATIASIVAGSAGLTKAGAGTLVLSGPNTWTGGTTISAGVLQIGNGTNTTAAIGGGTITDGGVLAFDYNGAQSVSNAWSGSGTIVNIGAGTLSLGSLPTGSMTINGGTAGIVVSPTLTTSSNNFYYQGNVTINGSAAAANPSPTAPGATLNVTTAGSFWWIGSTSLANAVNMNISSGVTVSLASNQGAGNLYYNNMSGAGNFTYNGNATGYIVGNVSMTGRITANNQNISFGNGGAGGTFSAATPITNSAGVTFNSTTNTTYSGVMTGGSSVTKTASNTLTFSGTNTYTGSTTVNNGTLLLDFSQPGAPASNILYNGVTAGAWTLGPGTLSINGKSSGTSSQTLGNLTLNAPSSIVVTPNGGSGTTLTVGNTWTNSNNAILAIDLSAGNASSPATLASNPNASLVNGIIPWATVKDSSGFGFASISGVNVVRYTGATTPLPASGATGTLNYSLTGSTASTASQTVTANQTANSLSIVPTAAGQGLSINSGLTLGLTTGALAFNGGSAAFTISGPGQLGTGAKGLLILTNGPNALSIGAPISYGAGSLTVDGNGAVVLTTTSTYTGATVINAGSTLQLGNGSNDGSITSSGTITANGTLAFNIVNGQTYGSGVLSGNGSLTKTGAGTLTIGNEASYSGSIAVNGGTFQVNGTNSGSSAGIYNASSVTINNGGTLFATNQSNGLGLAGGQPVTVNAGGVLTANATYTETINGTLTLAEGALASTNSPTGDGSTYGVWDLYGGILAGGVATSSVISAQDVNIGSGSTITVNPGAANGIDLDVTGTLYSIGGVNKAGNGVMRLSGANTYTGPTTISGGTLIVGAGGSTGSLGNNSNVTDNAALIFNRSDSAYNYGGAISGTGTVAVIGGGTITLSGSNTYSGGTTITAGTLQVGSGGSAGSIASAGTNTITDNGGLAFARSDSVTYANAISGTGSVMQIGSGSLILAATNTYSGNTLVNSGKLYLNGPNSTTVINVAGGATLGGSGSAASATATIANGGILQAGYNGSGSLGLAGLNFSNTATINIANIANYSGVAAINVLGGNGLTTSGAVTIAVSGAAPVGSGPVELLQYSGVIQGTGSSAFALNTAGVSGLGSRALLSLSFSTAGSVDLSFGVDHPVWSGAGNGAWTTSSSATATGTTNWVLASSPSTATNFIAGDAPVFDDTAGTGTTTVNISSANVAPVSVTLNNDSLSYTLTGAYGITGSASLTKNGSGSLTIANSNGYSGGTTLNAGILNLNNAAALGSGTLTITGGTIDSTTTGITLVNNPQAWNGDFAFGGSNNLNLGSGAVTLGGNRQVTVNASTLTVGGPISGSGFSLAKTGAGMLVLGGSSTYNGGTTINAGALRYGVANALPTAGAVNVNGPAAVLDLGGFASSAGAVTLTAGTIQNGTLTGTSYAVQSGLISASLAGSGVALTQNAGGLSILAGNNTYGGGTTISAGTLQVGTGGTTGSLGSSAVANNATLAFNFGSGTTTVANTITGTGTIANLGAGAVTLSNNSLGSGANVYGGTAGIVLGNNIGSNGIQFQGLVTVNANGNGVVQSTAPGTTINVTTGLATLWTGASTAANAPSCNISSGATVSNSSGQGAGTLYYNSLAGAGNFTYNGNATGYILGNTSLTGTITAGNNCISFGNGGAGGTFSGGPTPIINSGGVIFNSTTNTTYSGVMSGDGAVIKSGSNTLTFTGANSYEGATTINGGTLQIGGGGIAGSLGSGSVTNQAAVVFNLSGNATCGNAIGGDGSLTQAGPGTLALTGTNMYTGTTTVNGGALIVNGSHSGGDAYAVAAGATLAGNGTISGTNTVTLAVGANLAPGNNAATGNAGTLTVPNLTISGGGTAYFDLASSGNTSAGGGINDLVAVTGNLAFSGATTVLPSPLGGSEFANGTYTLFTYGTLGPYSASSLVIAPGALSTRQSAIFDYGNTVPNAITLAIVANPHNLTWVGVGGGTSGLWDADQSAHTVWSSSGSADYFATHDQVTFDATAGTNTTVTLAGTLTPGAVTVTGSNNYTFTGTGKISSGTALVVQGPGSLTLANSGGNDYMLGTNLQGGTIVLGVANGISSAGTLTLGAAATNGTLDLAGFNQLLGGLAVGAGATASGQIIGNSSLGATSTLTFNSAGSSNFGGTIQDGINGSGGPLALTVAGGLLNLSGSNTYSGVTTISAGTLQLGSATALYAAGTMYPWSASNNLVANGTFDLAGYNAGVNGLGGSGIVTNSSTSSVALSVNQVSANTFSGTLQDGAGTLALYKTGEGVLVLSGTNSYSGGTTIDGGTLGIAADAALGNTAGGVTFSNNSTLQAEANGITMSSERGITIDNNVTATIDTQANAMTIAGTIGGAPGTPGRGGLTKVGEGTLDLTGAAVLNGTNSFTKVMAGVLQIDGSLTVPDLCVKNAAQLAGSGTINVTGGDGLLYQSTVASTFGGTISGSQLEIASGTLTLSGSANSYASGTKVDIPSARLTLAAAGALPAGTAAAINGTLDLGGYSASVDTLTGNGTVDNLNGSGGNTLTIGSNGGSSTFSGAIQSTAGPLALQKTGSGTFTLTGSSTYTGGTTMNGGMLVAADGPNTSTAFSALGTGPLTLNGGTLAAGLAGGSVAGLVQAGSAAHTIAPGAGLAFGQYGVLNLNGGLSVNANTTLAFNFNTGAVLGSGSNGCNIYSGDLINLGTAALTGGSGTIAGSSPLTSTGDYRLIQGSNLGAANLGAFSLPVAPSGDVCSLSTTADNGFLDLVVATAVNSPNYTLAATAATRTIISGGSTAVTVTLANTGGSGSPDGIAFSGLTATSAAGGAINGTPGSGTAAPGLCGSNSVSFTSSVAGAYSIAPCATVNGVNGTTPSLTACQTLTLNVLDHAAGSLAVAAGNNFLSHAGATGLTATIAASNAAGTRSELQLDTDPAIGSGSLTGGPATIAAGMGQTYTATFNTPTAGSYSNVVTFSQMGDNQAYPGALGLAASSTTIYGSVFSGSGTWAGGNGTSWGSGASPNWTDANGVQAAPGTFQGFNDTAVLDDTGGTNTTITLDGVSPTLGALTFNTTAGGSYTLSQGSGAAALILSNGGAPGTPGRAAASVTVLAGTHTISAPITLSSSGSFGPVAGTQLTLSGNISDGGAGLPLLLTDAGTLILGGTANSYSGGTYVDRGTLIVNNSGALQDGSSLIVGAGGVFIFDPTASGAPLAGGSPAGAVVPVPEPGTIVLLLAALWSVVIYGRRKGNANWH